jgi:hypothetical protein
MAENTNPTAREQVYRTHHRDQDFWPAPYPVNSNEIEFVTSEPPADAFDDAPKYRGRFKKGYDPRRHRFTPEECSRGFWTAIAVYGVGIGDKLHRAGRWPGYRGKH